LEFKRDFDFRPTRECPPLKNRGFANIANAQVQHDGKPLIASSDHSRTCPLSEVREASKPMIAAVLAHALPRAVSERESNFSGLSPLWGSGILSPTGRGDLCTNPGRQRGAEVFRRRNT
jgi:hypothetical protein